MTMVSNSNWTEWSTIQGVIGRVISKSREADLKLREIATRSNYQLIVTITKFALCNYSGMTRTTVQLQEHDVCNCTITAEIRPADDQSDSRILI